MNQASDELTYNVPIDPEVVRKERTALATESRTLLLNFLEHKYLEDDQLNQDPLKCAKAILYFMLGKNYFILCETTNCEKYFKTALGLFD